MSAENARSSYCRTQTSATPVLTYSDAPNLGVAFKHEDGEGYNLLLQALPTEGKLVMRTYKDDAEPKEDDKKAGGKIRAFMGGTKSA